MKTIQIEVYEFDDLSDAAKEKAREWWRSGQFEDSSWCEFAIDEVVIQGELLGIEFATRDVKLHGGDTRQDPQVYWRGFWSQGDGACFKGTWHAKDVKAVAVAAGWGDAPETTEIKRIAAVFDKIAKEFPHAYFKVEHRGHYYHEHCTEFTFDIVTDEDGDNQGAPEEKLDAAEAALTEAAKDFMRWIYKQLESAYDDAYSDDNIDDTIRCNEYLFTESGKRSVTLYAD